MYLTKKHWCWFWFPECGGCDPDATGPRLSWPRGHRASNPAPHHSRQQRSGSNSLHFLSHKQNFIFTKHFVTYHRSLLKKPTEIIQLFLCSGTLRVWDIEKAKCVYIRKELIGRARDNEEEEQNITQALYSKALESVAVVTFDNNITMCKMQDLTVQKQVCGFTMYMM